MLKRKERFQKMFRRRFSLRLHMVLILCATASSGLLASKLFHVLHIENMVIRYPLAVLFSYLVFFACIKLWLLWVTSGRSSTSGDYGWIDIPTSSGSRGGSDLLPGGGGGHFSGAGASGAFDETGASAGGRLASVISANDAADSSTTGAGSVVGGAADILDGDSVAAIVAMVVLAALVATVVGSAIYVVTEAPLILSEAAFDGLLAASLAKRASLFSEDWVGSIFKQTWKPFLITCAVTFLAALVLQRFFPAATSLTEIVHGI
jgi:hypothetical protein